VSQRTVRDCYGILEKKAKKRKREIENGTGISPEDSELDLAIEEVIEKWEAADQEFQLDYQSKVKKLEKDKETAEEMLRMSMGTLCASKKRKSDPDESAEEKRCKKRRGGSDTVQSLKEHSEMEFTFKREELEAKKSEQSLLTEQQMISMLQQPLQQQQMQQQLHYVYGIPEAASAAYGDLISENVITQIECIAVLLTTSSNQSRELCCVVT